MKTLSIIIVNYKSWGILKRNLDLLVSYKFSDFEMEVIVVDNCSNDGELITFSEKFPSINFIENTGNWGFAHGCNLGAKHAKGEILLFLNPDTIAPKGALEKMFLYYISNENSGIVSCKQSEKPSSYQKITPSILTLFGPQRSLYKLIFQNKFKETNCQTCNCEAVSPDWISGSVVMISRKWFEKIEGWNTDYWMYSEDVELSRKVADAGGDLRLLCNANIKHEHGGASRINPITSALTKTEVIISQHVFIRNNFSKIQKILSHIILIINTLIFKTFFGIIGMCLFFLPKARVQFYILKNCLIYYFSVIKNRTWISPRSEKFNSR